MGSEVQNVPLISAPNIRRSIRAKDVLVPVNGVRHTRNVRSSSHGSNNSDSKPWADPCSKEWDVVRFLQDDSSVTPDNLLTLPPPHYSYMRDLKAHKPSPLNSADRSAYDLKAHPKKSTPLPVVPTAGKIREKQDPRDPDLRALLIEDAKILSEVSRSNSVVTDVSTEKSSEELSDVFSFDIYSARKLTRGSTAGGKLSRKTLNKARDIRSDQVVPRRRLGERHKESPTRPASKRSPRQRNSQ